MFFHKFKVSPCYFYTLPNLYIFSIWGGLDDPLETASPCTAQGHPPELSAMSESPLQAAAAGYGDDIEEIDYVFML